MRFDSPEFFLFFVLVLIARNAPIGWRGRKGILLGASYLFYAAWNVRYLPLLLLCTTVDHEVARRLPSGSPQLRRMLLFSSVSTNIGLLLFFKLHVDLTTLGAALLGMQRPAGPELFLPFLPLGISFYTFQSLSYTLDVYRGRLAPASSRLDHALYVAFFPQLLAGPIVRATHFLPQLAEDPGWDPVRFRWGLTRFLIGLAQKMFLVDAFLRGPAFQVSLMPLARLSQGDLWVGAAAGVLRILVDFTAYSTMAIGLGGMLGFRLPENFHFPLAAEGFRDFWRRNHITLTSWIRDYVFLGFAGRSGPLAGTFGTMVLVGVWHKASLKGLVAGGLYGCLMLLERRPLRWLRRRGWTREGLGRFGLSVGVFVTHCLFFMVLTGRDLQHAGARISTMFGLREASLVQAYDALTRLEVLGTLGVLWLIHFRYRDQDLRDLLADTPSWLLVALVALGLFGGLTASGGGGGAHVYFQF